MMNIVFIDLTTNGFGTKLSVSITLSTLSIFDINLNETSPSTFSITKRLKNLSNDPLLLLQSVLPH